MAEIPLERGLHIVSTPIGRARDITLHALDVLAGADLLVAEDTRVLRKLLTIHGISLNDRPLVSHHDHSSERELKPILDALSAGKIVAYASDAGTPMVSDPGYRLVNAALELGANVHSAPGASALLAALSVSGLPSDRFQFSGFLSAKSTARRGQISEIVDSLMTSVFYDTPRRLAATLQDCKDILPAEREIVLCRELTKRHEQIVRSTVETLTNDIASGEVLIPEKGELVILVGPAAKREIDDDAIRKLLSDLIDDEGVKRASKAVSEQLNVARNRVYALALEIKNDRRE